MSGRRVRQVVSHSHCVQVRSNDISNSALSIFTATAEGKCPFCDGRGNLNGGPCQTCSGSGTKSEIPLVIIPAPRSSWSLYFMVPSGVDCLLQCYGKSEGVATPGLKLFKLFWWRVAYCVTRQSCTYDAPVMQAVTKDDVRVNIDVVLVFKIVNSIDFVYKLGAKNFDDLLSGVVDEGTRMLVRSESHETVYSLRGSRSQELLTIVNKHFTDCGVEFTDVKVTAVWLPDELASVLEETTVMELKMERIKKQYEFECIQIRQESDMAIAEIERKTEQTIVQQTGDKKRCELEFEQKSVKCEEEGRVALIEAETQAEVTMLELEAQLKRTEVSLETVRVSRVAEAEAAANTLKKQADEEAEVKIIQAEWKEEEMVCNAQAQKYEAAAEAEASKSLRAKRLHELLMREKDILCSLAKGGQFNIVGTPGDRLVGALMNGSMKQQI